MPQLIDSPTAQAPKVDGNILQTLYTILAIIFLGIGSYGHAQTSKLQIELQILPELGDIFKNEEISIRLLGDSVEKKTIKNSDRVIFDALDEQEIVIQISSYIKNSIFEKYYSIDTGPIKLQKDSTVTVRISFPENCQFNINGINKICPKCKKDDKVIPVRYGLTVPLYDEKGNLIKEPKFRSGGCTVSNCDPSWYCERNNLSF